MITPEDIESSRNTPAYRAFCKGLFYGYRVGLWANALFIDRTSLWQQFIGQCRKLTKSKDGQP